jgi:protein SCO1/2
MTDRPVVPTRPPPIDRRTAVAGALLAVVLGLLAAGLLGLALLAPGDPPAAVTEPAPPLELTDQDGRPFALTSQLGRPVLLFFGYTHCPDVCPATVGVVNEVLAAVGDGPRVVFTSIDPERDDVAAMRSYLRYLPGAYVGLTGTPQEVQENAFRWGVKYARIDQGSAAGYAMAHTADIFLVDAQGMLRTRFAFGTEPEPVVEALRALLAETAIPPSTPTAPAPSAVASPGASGSAPTPTPATPTASPAGLALYPEVVSTSIWAGTGDPVILRAVAADGTPLDGTIPLSVQLAAIDGSTEGAPVAATAVLPEGETRPFFVALLDIPAPGAWMLRLTAGTATGEITFQALDPGGSLAIGGPAPAIDTPTLDDAGGVVRAVTTQPNPDLRLSQTSTADALAMGKPYVLVIDSARFKVSPECGRALTMIRYLVDRWGDEVVFVHLEPFEYQVITSEPVLSGSLTDPPLNRYASAFGLGDAAWPATKMPWIFVVDASGTVRAKYTGIVGSADVDVILTQVLGAGAAGG